MPIRVLTTKYLPAHHTYILIKSTMVICEVFNSEIEERSMFAMEFVMNATALPNTCLFSKRVP